MNAFAQVIYVESLKARRSRMTLFTALGFALLPLVCGFFMVVLKDRAGAAPRADQRQARIVAGAADWPTYLGLLAQAIAGGGMVLFGLIGAWVFGREYSDRTLKDLLALPTSRSTIVLAKFIVVAAWSAALTVMICLIGLGVGAAVGLAQASAPVILNDGLLIAQAACLTIALLTPVAFFADRGARLSGANRFRVSRPVTGAGDRGRGMGRVFSLVHPVVGFTGHGFGTRELRYNHPDLRRWNRRHADVVEAGRPDALIAMMIGCTEPSRHPETPMNQPGRVAPHNPDRKSHPPRPGVSRTRFPTTWRAYRRASRQLRDTRGPRPGKRDAGRGQQDPAGAIRRRRLSVWIAPLRRESRGRSDPQNADRSCAVGGTAPVSWHMVGHVQSRKAEGVLPWAGMLHSVESKQLAGRMSARACPAATGVTLPVLIEVNVAGEASKYGVTPTELPVLAAQVVALPGLRLEGLMTIAPIAANPETVRPVFLALPHAAATSCDVPSPACPCRTFRWA